MLPRLCTHTTRRRDRPAFALLLLLGSLVVMVVVGRLPRAAGFLLTPCSASSSSSRASFLWGAAHRRSAESTSTATVPWHIYSPRSRSLASSAAGSDGSTAGSDDATSDPAPTTTPPASPASPKAKSASGTPFGKKASAPTAAGAAAVAKKKPQPAKLPRSKNLLIVGLGNPGKEYTMTRHNAGFLVIDELAKRLGADLKLRSAFQGEYGSTTYQGKSIGLLKPTTFMNNSGQSLRKVLDYFKLTISSVLVVVDEVALDMGQIRLRQTGSAGGHNGLKSIEGYLKSKDYNRLRIGVGGAAPGQMVDHVLDDFTRSERKQLDDLLMDAVEAIEDWIEDDNTDKVMTRVNAPR